MYTIYTIVNLRRLYARNCSLCESLLGAMCQKCTLQMVDEHPKELKYEIAVILGDIQPLTNFEKERFERDIKYSHNLSKFYLKDPYFVLLLRATGMDNSNIYPSTKQQNLLQLISLFNNVRAELQKKDLKLFLKHLRLLQNRDVNSILRAIKPKSKTKTKEEKNNYLNRVTLKLAHIKSWPRKTEVLVSKIGQLGLKTWKELYSEAREESRLASLMLIF